MGEQLAMQGGAPVRTLPFGPSHYFGEEDMEALSEVINSGSLGKGPKVKQFEREFAARHGVAHVVTVTSGTAAMHTCVGAINPDPGDEIIVTPWTSGGSIIGTLLHNCLPIFADVDDTYTLDPADVEAKITPRTRAIIAVHLFGNPCDMAALRDIADRHQIFLIEDCCQAHFAGIPGQGGWFDGRYQRFQFRWKASFCRGWRGNYVGQRDAMGTAADLLRLRAAARWRAIRGRPYANYFLAPNYKLNDLMAAVLISQLKKVDGYIEKKVQAAEGIIDQVSDIEEITPQRVRGGGSELVLGVGHDAGHGQDGV